MSSAWLVGFISVWSALRLAEYVWSEANLGSLLARGAVESCRPQHVPLLLLNAAVPLLTFAGVALARTGPGWLRTPGALLGWAAAAAVLGEVLHWWAILTLGRRWTTGVLVLPNEQPVRTGPYRWLRHPGYLGGGLSGALLPLLSGAWPMSVIAGAGLLTIVRLRIACEDQAWRAAAAPR